MDSFNNLGLLYTALSLTVIASVLYFYMKRVRSHRKIVAENGPKKVSIYEYLAVKCKMFSRFTSPIIVTSRKGKVYWLNELAQENTGLELKDNINSFFDYVDELGSRQIEFRKGTLFFQGEFYEETLFAKDKVHIYTLNNDKSQYVASTPFVFNKESEYTVLKTVVENVVQQKAHLFQVAGITASFHIHEDMRVGASEEKIGVAIDHLLFASYLFLKDKRIEHKHISVSCDKPKHSARICLKFRLSGLKVSFSDLSEVHIFSGKKSDTIANVLKRNDLSLSQFRCRTSFSVFKDKQGRDHTDIEMSFDDQTLPVNDSSAQGTAIN